MIASITFINPAIPAAVSKCPIFVFTEPIGQRLPLGKPYASVKAATSIVSPNFVPLPCISTKSIVSEVTSARFRALEAALAIPFKLGAV